MKTLDEILKNLLDDSTARDIYDYIRSGISVEEKRHVLLEVERKIKEIAGTPEEHCSFKLFSEQDAWDLNSLVEIRSMILDEMMPHTPEEMERFKYQNKKLLELSDEARKQERNMIRMFYHTPYREEDNLLYAIEKKLVYTWGDEDAVIKMENDEYYGSDFSYMLQLINELTERMPSASNLINECSTLLGDEEEALKANEDKLDDGTTWADGRHLHHEAFNDICICYAVHAICTHLPYSIPDLLRMDDFYVCVKLEYQHEVSEQRYRGWAEEEANPDQEEMPVDLNKVDKLENEKHHG